MGIDGVAWAGPVVDVTCAELMGVVGKVAFAASLNTVMQEVGGVMDSGAGTGHSEGAGTNRAESAGAAVASAALHGAAEFAVNASKAAPLARELGTDLGASAESGNEALLGPVCSDIVLPTAAGATDAATKHGSAGMIAVESSTCGGLLLSARMLLSAAALEPEVAAFSCT